MHEITGIGNALVDVLAHISDNALLSRLGLPEGSMQLIDARRFGEISAIMSTLSPARATGGSAANTMLALARLGNAPSLVAKVGRDDYGRFYEDTCRRAGVDTRFLYSDTGTGVASTFVSPGGQRTFATFLGAAAELGPDDIGDAMFGHSSFLYLEGYLVQNHALVDRAVSLARSRSMKVCLDMASYNIVEADREYFTRLVRNSVDIVFANEDESRAFTGLAPEAALDALAACCGTAVVKLGAKGAMAARRNPATGSLEKACCPAGKVEHVIDTTAAGDFFAAGFLHGSVRGCTLEQCLAAGTVLSAEVIQVTGTALPDARWEAAAKSVEEICK